MGKQISKKKKISIAIGCDHAGFDVAKDIFQFLNNSGYDVDNQGCYSLDSVDYPEYGHKVGRQVAKGNANKGIVVCGSGIGISIAANKVKGVRAALCFTKEHAEMSRRHNDSNVLALGARMKGGDKILDIVDKWLATDFEGDRHQRRIEKIEIV